MPVSAPLPSDDESQLPSPRRRPHAVQHEERDLQRSDLICLPLHSQSPVLLSQWELHVGPVLNPGGGISVHRCDLVGQLDCTNGTAADRTCSFYAPVDQDLSEMLQGANRQTFMVIETMPPAFLEEAGWDLFNITGAFAAVQWVKALKNIANYPPARDSAIPFPYVAPQTTFEAVRCLFYFGVREVSASVMNGISTNI